MAGASSEAKTEVSRWESRDAVDAFRGDGPSGDQQRAITSGHVAEYGAVEEELLLG